MRLLVDDEWYDAISSEGQYETDFESVIFHHSESLFPEYYAVPFKVQVESEAGVKMPDVALIDRQYRHWWVVEVEMAHHSLAGHVLPQVEVFASGRYGAKHANHIIAHARRHQVEPSAVEDMIKGAQPGVLVVVNQNVPRWVEPIRSLQGLVMVVEVFRSFRNQHVLRVNGDRLVNVEARLVSRCRLDRVLPRLLQVDSPAALQVTLGEKLYITFRGGMTEWERMDASNRVWLAPTARNPLKDDQDYWIMRADDDTLYFLEA